MDASAVDVENADGLAFGTLDDDAAVGGIDVNVWNIMLINSVATILNVTSFLFLVSYFLIETSF